MTTIVFNDGDMPSGYWRYITYGGGTFVAVADDSSIAYSTDGIRFTSVVVLPSSAIPVSVAYGNSNFVVFYIDGTVATSIDGILWTLTLTLLTSIYQNCGTFGNGTFRAIGSELPTVEWSPDGRSWDGDTSSLSPGRYRFLTGTDTHVYVSDGNQLFYCNAYPSDFYPATTDGGSLLGDWLCLCKGNGFTVVMTTSQTYYSTDGQDFIQGGNISDPHQWNSVTYGNGVFVAVTPEGFFAVATAPDSLWTVYPMTSPANNSILYSGSLFTSVGPNSTSYGVIADVFQYFVTYAGTIASNGNTWISNDNVVGVQSTFINTLEYPTTFTPIYQQGTKLNVFMGDLTFPPGTPINLTFAAPTPFIIPGSYLFMNEFDPLLLFNVSDTSGSGGCIITFDGTSYNSIYEISNGYVYFYTDNPLPPIPYASPVLMDIVPANFDFEYGVSYDGVVVSGTWTSNNIVTNIPTGKILRTEEFSAPAFCNIDSNNYKIQTYLSGVEVSNGPLTLTFVAPQPLVVPSSSWFIFTGGLGPRLLYDVSNTEPINGSIYLFYNDTDYDTNIRIIKDEGSGVVTFTGSLDETSPILCELRILNFFYGTYYYGLATTSNTLIFNYLNGVPNPVRVISDDDGPPMVVSLSSNVHTITAVFDSNVIFTPGNAYYYGFDAPGTFSLDSYSYILGDGSALAYSVIVPSAPEPLTGLCTINYAPVKYTINSNGFVTLDGTVQRNLGATQYYLSSTVYQPINTDVYCQFDRSNTLHNGYVNTTDNLTTAWGPNVKAPGIYIQRVSPNIISNSYLNIQFRANGNMNSESGIGVVNSHTLSGDPKTRRDCIIYLTYGGDLYIQGSYIANISQSFNGNDSILLNMDIQNSFYQFFSSQEGASRQYEADSDTSELYVFASFAPGYGQSFTIQYPSLYASYELSGARMIPYKYPGLYPDRGTIYLTTPTAIGVRWPDKTSSANYQVQTTNTNSGRDVGDDEVSGGSFFYKNTLEPDSQYNMMIQYAGDGTWYPLLSGIDTAIVGKNIQYDIRDYNNIIFPLYNISQVPSPWMICLTSLQIVHPVELPIRNYKLVCADIGFEQPFKYQGKSFEFVSPTTNSTLGTPITHDFSLLTDPNEITFVLTYDSSYGTTDNEFKPGEITFFSLAAYIYTYQLFLYGIN